MRTLCNVNNPHLHKVCALPIQQYLVILRAHLVTRLCRIFHKLFAVNLEWCFCTSSSDIVRSPLRRCLRERVSMFERPNTEQDVQFSFARQLARQFLILLVTQWFCGVWTVCYWISVLGLFYGCVVVHFWIVLHLLGIPSFIFFH